MGEVARKGQKAGVEISKLRELEACMGLLKRRLCGGHGLICAGVLEMAARGPGGRDAALLSGKDA
jgi:hypothetical protein